MADMRSPLLTDVSVGAYEREQERRFFQIQDRCLSVLRVLFGFAIPLTMVNITFAAVYAWIFANQYSYLKDDWQRCFVHPNSGALYAFGTYTEMEDATNYLVAASSYAGRVFIFILVTFKMAYVGVRDIDVLPYSIFTCFMSLLGILVYREAEPIQPQPTEISATLLTLSAFIRPDMYTFSPSNKNAPQHCDRAYSLNIWFLRSQYIAMGLVLVVMALTVTCAAANYRVGKRWSLQLKGNVIPLLLLVVAFGGYVTCFVAKERVAQATLYVLRNGRQSLRYIFPFHKGELDIVSMTMMMTLGAIGVGICKGDLEKIKLGAFVAYLHVVLSYPSMLGTMHAYHSLTYPYTKAPTDPGHHVFDLWRDCPAYIEIKKGALFTPEFSDQINTICSMVHASMVGQMVQFVAQHLVVLSCIYILWANRDLPAQKFLRLGSYTPAYMDAAKVALSVNAPLDGFLSTRWRGKRSKSFAPYGVLKEGSETTDEEDQTPRGGT